MPVIDRHHVIGDRTADGTDTNENRFVDADDVEVAATIIAHRTKAKTVLYAKALFDVPTYNTGTLTLRLRAGGESGDVFATVAWTPQAGEDAVLEGEISFESIGASGGSGSEFHAEGQGWATGESVTRTILQDRTTIDTRENWEIIPTAQWSAGHADNDVVMKSFRVWQVDGTEQT